MIEREDVADIAVVRLARGKVNALDLELLGAITETFAELDTSAHRAVVLTGAGRAFSAGVDLRRIVDGGPEYVAEFLPALSDAFLAVFTIGKPVVAAVNGHAIAGGTILACACDHRLMADANGRVGVTELAVGVAFPLSALEILGYAMGERPAREAVLSAATYAPAEALDRGFVNELVAPEHLLTAATEYAQRVASQVPADTYRLTKAQLQLSVTERLASRRPSHDPRTADVWIRRLDDGGLRSYLERLATPTSRNQ